MKFRTNIEVKPSDFTITHQDNICFLGSCFSQNIGSYMESHGFQCLVNPCGTLFHPISIFQVLDHAISEKIYTEADLIFYHDRAYPLYQTKKTHLSTELLLQDLNDQRIKNTKFLQKSKVLFLTLGTSFAYKHVQTNQIVANCHKIPANQFEKIFTESEDIMEYSSAILKKIFEALPHLTVIITISPVKHIRDGIVENSFSKANLHHFTRKLLHFHNQITYFPAFELLTEDLRDYRFYESDLIHPNNMAIDYIISHFEETYFSPETLYICSLFKKLNQALRHNIHAEHTSEIEKFEAYKKKILADLSNLGFHLDNLPS